MPLKFEDIEDTEENTKLALVRIFVMIKIYFYAIKSEITTCEDVWKAHHQLVQYLQKVEENDIEEWRSLRNQLKPLLELKIAFLKYVGDLMEAIKLDLSLLNYLYT